MSRFRFPGKVAFWVLSIAFLFHLFLALNAGFVPDEAYYWTWTLQPSLSYFDHPPMIAWMLWLSTHLFGATHFGIRFPSLVISVVIGFFLYLMGKEILKDRWAGLWAVFLVTATLLFSAGAFLMTPDSIVILFFILTLFSFYRAIEFDSDRLMLLSGAWFGMGLLSKYTMVLLGPLLVLFLLIDDRGRRWFSRPSLWGAGMIAFLLFTPVIYWNSQHNWASFRFQWHHGMQSHQMAPLSGLSDYFGGQIGVVTPIIDLFILGAGIVAGVRLLRNPSRPMLYFWITSYPILLFFAYSSLKAKVEANWPVEGYLGAFLVTGALLVEWEERAWIRRTAYAGVGLGFFANLLVGLQIFWPVLPIASDVDPTGRMAGFGTETHEIQALEASIPQNLRPKAWLVDGYSNTSLLKIREYGRMPVYEIHPKRQFRTTTITEEQANSLVGKPVFLIQNGPSGGFFRGLDDRYGHPRFLGTIRILRKGSKDKIPILVQDVYLIPSFKNGLSEEPPPNIRAF